MAGFLATVDFSNPYFPVLVLLVIALAMSVGFVLLSQALGPKRYDRIKYGVYECGVDPLTPAAVRVSVKFYLLAILFILFDLETTFRLLADVPAGTVVLAESGITRSEDVENLEKAGVDAIVATSPPARIRLG